jgi:protein-disulfide isomerase
MPTADRRRRRLLLLGGLLVVAIAVVAAGIGISQSGSEDEPAPPEPGGQIQGVAETTAEFRGIPQDGVTLGRPDAPVTLTEFADLQCPFCRDYALEVMPVLIERYVRPGRMKMVFRNLAFIGPESEEAARLAAGAGAQDKLWETTDLIYRNQGPENSGWVTPEFLESVADAVPGLDADAALSAAEQPAADAQLRAAAAQAQRAGIDSTPSFLLGRTGAQPRRLEVSSLTPDQFAAAIDELLGGR